MPTDFARQAFGACTDFAIHNRSLTTFLGGANLHVIHHLFPSIHHVHCPHLLPILQEVAEQFGVEYRHTTVLGSLAAHYRFLKRAGQPDPSPTVSHDHALGPVSQA